MISDYQKYLIIREERERYENSLIKDLEKMGVTIETKHFTGDSSFPTVYYFQHKEIGEIIGTGPTLDMGLMDFVRQLLKHIVDSQRDK